MKQVGKVCYTTSMLISSSDRKLQLTVQVHVIHCCPELIFFKCSTTCIKWFNSHCLTEVEDCEVKLTSGRQNKQIMCVREIGHVVHRHARGLRENQGVWMGSTLDFSIADTQTNYTILRLATVMILKKMWWRFIF